MKKMLVFVFALMMVVPMVGCQKVPAGNVGVKVYLLGGYKGVDTEELGPGRYWIGINEELYLFPTYTVTYPWTKSVDEGSENDESITFQTKEGLSVNADVGISYHIDPSKATLVFQKYRKGIDEITDLFLRNMVRDAFVTSSSSREVESVYGVGKNELITEVEQNVRNQTAEIGIVVEKIYFIGDLRLPDTVITAINSKIEATQKAQQRENELREAEAEAKKVVAKAEGEAQSTLTIAKAEAESIRMKSAALTPQIVQYEAIQKWDGVLPKFSGGGVVPFINVDDMMDQ